MVPTPKGWQVHRGAREIVLVHPEGLAAGGASYQERLRPLAPVATLVAEALAARAPFTPRNIAPHEVVVTDEGEYGALVTVGGTLAGEPAQIDLGFVFFEDHYSRIAGVTTWPERFEATTATVRDLLVRDGYLLGPRPRRTRYARPAGWHGVARGLMTEWYPKGFPRDRAILTVWPALPTARDPVGWWKAGCQPDLGFVGDSQGTALPVVNAHDVSGRSWRLVRKRDDRPALVRDVVALEDDRYVYLFRLDDGSDLQRDALAGIVRTTQPIPRRRAERLDSSALDHWV